MPTLIGGGSNSRNQWDVKQRMGTNQPDVRSEDSEEEFLVPEYKHAFSTAVARALDAAAARKSAGKRSSAIYFDSPYLYLSLRKRILVG